MLKIIPTAKLWLPTKSSALSLTLSGLMTWVVVLALPGKSDDKDICAMP